MTLTCRIVFVLAVLCSVVLVAQDAGEAARLNLQIVTLFKQAKYREALAEGKRAIDFCLRELGEDHETTASVRNNIAACHSMLGDYVAAAAEAEKSLKTRRKIFGEEDARTATAYYELGRLSVQLKDIKNAIAMLELSVRIRTKALGEKRAETADAWFELGRARFEAPDLPAATAAFKKAVEIREEVLGPDQAKTAEARYFQALVLVKEGNFIAAEPIFEIAHKSFLKQHGKNDFWTAKSDCELGSMLARNGKPLEAEEHLTKGIQTLVQLHYSDESDLASYRLNLANCLFDSGRAGDALPIALAALAVKRRLSGETHPQTLGALKLAAQCESDWEKARTRCEELIQTHTKQGNPDDVAVADAWITLGVIARTLEPKTAPSAFEEAIRIQTRGGREATLATANMLRLLGESQSELNRMEDAKKALNRAAEICNKTVPVSVTAAAVNLALGSVQLKLGNPRAARPLMERGVALSRKASGDFSGDTAIASLQLANVLIELQEFAGANAALDLAGFYFSRKLSPQAVAQAALAESRARLSELRGDNRAAGEFYEQASSIYRGRPNDRFSALQSEMTLGQSQFLLGDFANAQMTFERVLGIAEKQDGSEKGRTLQITAYLGRVSAGRKDLAAAADIFERLLPKLKTERGAGHPETLRVAFELANLYFALSKEDAAAPLTADSLQLLQKTFGDEHPETLRTMSLLADIELRAEKWDAAARLRDAERKGTGRMVERTLYILSNFEQVSYLNHNDRDRQHAALYLGLVRNSDANILDQSTEWLVNGKGKLQRSLSRQAEMLRTAPAVLAEPAREIAIARSKLARMAMESVSAENDENRGSEMEHLGILETTLAARVAAASGRQHPPSPWIELSQFRAAIPANSIYIDFVRLSPPASLQPRRTGGEISTKYVAWIIPPAGNRKPEIVALGTAAEIDASVRAARVAINQAVQSDRAIARLGEAAAESDARIALAKLADLVWKPIIPAVGEAKNLIISPDSQLWLAPWAAMPIGDNEFLLEKHSIRLVCAGRDVIMPKIEKISTAAPTIFADPNFDLGSSEAVRAFLSVYPGEANAPLRVGSARSGLGLVERLPNTAIEAKFAATNLERLAGAKPVSFSDQYALESLVKRVVRPKMLVFATHGFFMPDRSLSEGNVSSTQRTIRGNYVVGSDGERIENPLLRSGLLLAGCNHPQTLDDDGILTGLEIIGLDLRGTALVVLSACETGVGEVSSGEGVAGLRSAFQIAGARSVVSTLWQVPDRDSALIMSDFFANLAAGQTNAESLRNAQLARIAARRQKFSAAHPIYWAAWTTTGD